MLSNLVTPKSVAVIGVSASPEKIGHQILSNLVNDFRGEIYPVNLKGGEILGLRVFQNIKEINLPVDLAVICIPSLLVKDALKDCADAGVKTVIIISAGFSETGLDGERLQQEIMEICQKSGMILLGPNCLGVINTGVSLNASFANAMPPTGNISFISQSGAMVSALIDWSRQSGIGFSKIFSLGNKAMLGESEILEYLYDDDSTDVIISYFENVQVTPKLTKIFHKYAKKKPTIVLFGGKSAAGAEAALSHTGSLVSSYSAVETYLKQAGVIVADTLEDLFNFSILFSRNQKITGDRIAIITNAGGPAIAASDSIIKNKLKLAEISDDTTAKLQRALKPEASVRNPIDLLGDATDLEYKNVLNIAISDPDIDGILVLLTPQSSTKVNETAENIAALETNKPVVSSFIGGSSIAEAKKIIAKGNKAFFEYPETAIKALSALYSFSTKPVEIMLSDPGVEEFSFAKKDELLRQFDLPVLESTEIKSEQEAMDVADKIGYPLVLKTAQKDVLHKSDVGAVKLNLRDKDQLLAAFREIGAPAVIQKMIETKHEIFLGIKKDPNIGTVVAFGSGGIYSEIYKDLAYRIAPIDIKIAKEMIGETKMGEILAGARGQKSYDLDKIAQTIVKTAEFADNFKNISEIDFNPVIADEKDFYLVDIRIIEK